MFFIIRWGILGLGNISYRFAKSLNKSKKGILYSVASHTFEKREKFKNQFKCNVIYDDYNKLLDDCNVDAVYIALPHGFHKEWSIKALYKNKAVLCEKPVTLNSSEIEEIKNVFLKENTFFMEAMKTRFLPAMTELKVKINSGIIGDILNITADFCSITKAEKSSYLFDEIMGGAILDIGIYPLSFVLDLKRTKILNVKTEKVLNHNKIDISFKSEILFEDNSYANISGAINHFKERTAFIYGTNGKIEVPMFNKLESFIIYNDNDIQKFNFPYENDDFFGQIEEVNNCLILNKKESHIMTLNESIRVMKILDIIKKDMNHIIN